MVTHADLCLPRYHPPSFDNYRWQIESKYFIFGNDIDSIIALLCLLIYSTALHYL